jgi:hypothetical protein
MTGRLAFELVESDPTLEMEMVVKRADLICVIAAVLMRAMIRRVVTQTPSPLLKEGFPP